MRPFSSSKCDMFLTPTGRAHISAGDTTPLMSRYKPKRNLPNMSASKAPRRKRAPSFIQRIAGPIVRYQAVADDFASDRSSEALFASGIARFTIGLGKSSSPTISLPWSTTCSIRPRADLDLQPRGSETFALRSRFILISPATPTWRSDLAKCSSECSRSVKSA